MTTPKKPPPKSYKREVAWCLLGVTLLMIIKLFVYTEDPKLATALTTAFNGWVLVSIPTAMAAFGLHSWQNKDK